MAAGQQVPFRKLMFRPTTVSQALLNIFTSSRYRVEGNSMLPALADREYVLLARTRFPFNRLSRGDLVVFKDPVGNDDFYVKRIVGLPDEEIRLEGGLVYLNGALLEEIYPTILPREGDEAVREWWTGPDEYFVMGDNRGSSQDSRSFGPVNRRLILGRVWFRYWPPRAWGPVSAAQRTRP